MKTLITLLLAFFVACTPSGPDVPATIEGEVVQVNFIGGVNTIVSFPDGETRQYDEFLGLPGTTLECNFNYQCETK